MLVQTINWEALTETYRMIFITIVAAIVISAILSILCNWATSEVEKERARKREEIQKSIMPNWSLENAMKINRETCNYDPENMRLIKGLYSTPEEAEKHIEESLIKPLI